MSSLIKEEVIEESALKFKPSLNLQILLMGQKGAPYSQRPSQKETNYVSSLLNVLVSRVVIPALYLLLAVIIIWLSLS